jgi:uncharacterized membrane protein YeaQ/YmgE (transglycosylase-associated protein family)
MTFGVYIVLIGVCGAVAGALAQRLVPGHGAMGPLQALSVGVAAALLGGLVGWYAIHSRIVGFLLAVVVAVGLSYILRDLRRPAAG